jgi:DNA replication and repair protein RecF
MVLASKIAEISLLETDHGRLPVLLLDDVSSELDAERNERLFEFLDRFEGQVFITTTDPAFLHIKAEQTTWQVDSGQVKVTEL